MELIAYQIDLHLDRFYVCVENDRIQFDSNQS